MTMGTHTGHHPSARARARAFALAVALWLLGAAGPVAAQVGAYTFEVEPDQPRAQQAVYAIVQMPGCRQISDVSFVQGVIEIGVRPTGCFIPPPGTRPQSASLGKLPQGTYRLRVVDAFDPARPGLSPERSLTVAPPVPGDRLDEFDPMLDYSGWWTRADADSGEGWLVEHKVPDRMMFSWVTYDADGNATWLVMQSTQRQHRVLSGPVYSSRRDGGTIVRTLVGQGRFESGAPDEAVFVLTPVGPGQAPVTTILRRLAF